MTEFSDKTYAELAKRKKELTSIYLNCQSNPVFIRCYLVMAVSHWEGFIRSSVIRVYEKIKEKKIVHSDLSPIFTTISLKDVIDNNNKNGKLELKIQVHDKIHKIGSEVFDFKNKSTGNFDYSSFKFLLNVFNMDEKPYELRENWFNSLFNLRHKIAHGDFADETISFVEGIHNKLNEYFDLFSKDINDYAENERYLKIVA